MARPTRVQREILATMHKSGEDIVDWCLDYPYAICVDQHRHLARRTFEALKHNGWIEPYNHPPSAVVYWYLTEAGRAVLAEVE